MTDKPITTEADTSLQGKTADSSDLQSLSCAIDEAFDYRGDVTITTASGQTIQGYIFDKSSGSTLAESFIRIIPTKGGERVTIFYQDIDILKFTGRDTAAGKSFDTWIKKYITKKQAGQAANIHAEPLN